MLDKKYETYTYSELLQEYKHIVEKTETLKKDIIIEMAKRKENEGIERKNIAKILYEDLKDYVSQSYIRNVIGGVGGYTDKTRSPGQTKKEIEQTKEEEEKKILVTAWGGQELEPQEINYGNDQENTSIVHDLMGHDDEDEEIIDQRPMEEREEDTAEQDIDRMQEIRDLKIENNNLYERLGEVERLRDENNQLRQTISELEKDNEKLFNKTKELEQENNKLKQEIRALRNKPASQSASEIPSRFSTKNHDEYHNKKYYKMTKEQ